MQRLVRISHVLLPVLLAAAAAGLRLQAGEAGWGLWLLMLGAALLGSAVAVMLESVAVMLGLVEDAGASQHRRIQLVRERDTLLRSIKDIELDGTLRKLDPDQVVELAAPLRQRAVEAIRDLEQAQLESRAGIEEQIERELKRRLGDQEKVSG